MGQIVQRCEIRMTENGRHTGPTLTETKMETLTRVPTIPEQPTRPRRPSKPLIAVAVILATATMVAVVLASNDQDDTNSAAAGPPLELSADGGDALASCLPVQADILADMSPALMATVTSVDGDTVTLDIDRWYAGGDADTVNLHANSGLEALIAGVDFEVGRHYLITATDGSVNFCGYSGLATPELTAIFDQAFPGRS